MAKTIDQKRSEALDRLQTQLERLKRKLSFATDQFDSYKKAGGSDKHAIAGYTRDVASLTKLQKNKQDEIFRLRFIVAAKPDYLR
jgi:hypothetical protein